MDKKTERTKAKLTQAISETIWTENHFAVTYNFSTRVSCDTLAEKIADKLMKGGYVCGCEESPSD